MSVIFRFPSIIPRSRLTLALVAIFLTAAILGSSTSLLYSVQESSGSFLATQDNIVVISNTKASTPFTSAVPLAMIETITQIKGVLLTSPEILLLGSSKGYSVMGRGIYPDNFTKLNEIRLVKGRLPTFNDTIGVSVGKNLAKVLGIDVGDTFRFISAVQTSESLFVVRGIFESGGLLDDEFLVSVIAAAPISRVNAGEVTHIQVMIDTNVISKEEFKEIIFSSFELTVFLRARNGTKSDEKAEVIVSLKSGDQVSKKIVDANGNSTFLLPFGTYVVSATIPYQTRTSYETVFLNKNTTIFLETGNFLRNVTLEFEVDDILVTNGTAKLYSSFTNTLIQTINLSGAFLTQLPESQYLAQLITIGGEEFWGEFRVNAPNQLIRIYLETKHPVPTLVSPRDGQKYSVNKIPLIISQATKYTYYSIDGSTLQKYEEPTSVSLTEGKHNVTVYLYNVVSGNYEVISSSRFAINSSLPMVIFSNYTIRGNTYFISNEAFAQQQVLSITIPFESARVEISGVLDEVIPNYNLRIQLEDFQSGIYSLKVTGFFSNQSSYSEAYTLVIDDNHPSFFGASLSSPMLLVPGASLPIRGINSSYSLRINETALSFNETHALIPNNQPQGVYEVIAEINETQQILGRIRIANSTDLFAIKLSIVEGLATVNGSSVEASSESVGLSFSSPYNTTLSYSLNGSTWRDLSGYLIFSGSNVQYTLNVSYFTPWGNRIFSEYTVKLSNSSKSIPSTATEITPTEAGINISLVWGDTAAIRAQDSEKSYEFLLTSTNSSILFKSDLESPFLLELTDQNISIELKSDFYRMFYASFLKDLGFQQAMLIDKTLFLDNPEFLTDGTYLVIESGSLRTVSTMSSISVSILGATTSNSSVFDFKIQGSYTEVQLLNSTIRYEFNPVSHLLSITVNQTQELTFIFKNIVGNFLERKITVYPNLPNVTLRFIIIDQASNSIIPSNITIFYEDNLETLNITNYDGSKIITRPGPLTVTITTQQGQQTLQGFYLENTNVTIKFGNAIVKIAVIDPNTGKFVSGARVSIRKQYSSVIIKQKVTPGTFWVTFELAPGRYSIVTEWLGRATTMTIEAFGDINTTIELPAILSNLTIFFNGVSEMPDDIQLLHVATGKKFTPSEIREDLFQAKFTSVYQGDVVLTYRIGERIETKILELYSSTQGYNIYIQQDNVAIKAKDLSKLASLGGVQLSESDKYLNSFISGPLELVKTVFMAELILVTFVVLINGIAVMRGVVSETKREIETLEYLGSSLFHIFMGIMKKIIAYGVIVAMIGTAMGIVLTDLIVRGLNVRLFSHTFYPSYNLRVYLVTGLLDIVVYILSFFIAYHIERRGTIHPQ